MMMYVNSSTAKNFSRLNGSPLKFLIPCNCSREKLCPQIKKSRSPRLIKFTFVSIFDGAFECFQRIVGGIDEEARIRSEREEAHAQIRKVFRLLGRQSDRPDGLAQLFNARDQKIHRLFDFGMEDVQPMPHVDGKIDRTEEDSADARRHSDRFHVLQAAFTLDLRQNANLVDVAIKIIRMPTVISRAHRRRSEAAISARSIRRPIHNILGLLAGLDLRDDDVLNADVEQLFDEVRARRQRTTNRNSMWQEFQPRPSTSSPAPRRIAKRPPRCRA